MSNGAADGADAVVVWAVDRDDGRGLREPVALNYGQPRAVEDEPQLFGQRCAAREEESYVAADALAPLREDDARREPVL